MFFQKVFVLLFFGIRAVLTSVIIECETKTCKSSFKSLRRCPTYSGKECNFPCDLTRCSFTMRKMSFHRKCWSYLCEEKDTFRNATLPSLTQAINTTTTSTTAAITSATTTAAATTTTTITTTTTTTTRFRHTGGPKKTYSE